MNLHPQPDNVLLKADSSSKLGLTAKITDFGLSTNLGPHATHASNFTGGTPYYAAPEVAMTGRTSKASDAFSFGVIMAELYSRSPPWVKVNGIFSANPNFPNFPPGTPPPFMNLAYRCLEIEMSKRPRFEEIVASLQEMLRELN
ncbi:kinase-like domain-containing protein [Dunaliella salina]|uniref:Kinase-like domain-containing protein n=1 Tax=Dunaliella salina TaxID=3046 RepID=A0ABQ7G036_DUNSA|nr:kinase-like domain-containing protein [Dunaliella salina]|eukprot:KAF5827963.1 kinase-like domain-containing protein [Dunaliella salina]